MPSLAETKAFVRDAHKGQTDKGGKPYHEHVERVALRVGAMLAGLSQRMLIENQDEIIQAALLHDVIEDTPYSADDLIGMGFSSTTVMMVKMVTKDPKDGLTYMQRIDRIAESGVLGVILIKLADNQDNSAPERLAALPQEEQGIARRYEKSMAKLQASLAKMGIEVA